ncbi:MAG: NADH-quinone oxidoreductase subunit M [Terracidiphilus sp.]|jgi:NADH-quinone oxidoreductase subunit M
MNAITMDGINNSILTLILLAPLAGALLLLLAPDRWKLPNWIALATTLVTFGLALHLPAHFSLAADAPRFQFEVNLPWIETPKIYYHLGVDGLSLWLVVLVGLLAPIGVIASWNAIQSRRKIFFALFLVQQTAMLGVFLSLDLMLYYGFWELSLVPMAILIAMYGRKDGPRAALKFFLFTFIPSAPLLVAILWLYARTGSFDYTMLQMNIASGVIPAWQLGWIALAFLFAFAVKVPVFPLHGWLADTFSEAPVALAMVVAGKLGLYSMLRFHIGLFPAQARVVAPVLIGLAVIGILYGACLALVQRDFWRLMAFAALSHLSLITLGIYGLTLTGWEGAVYQILNHGVVDGALFLLLGVLYDRYASSEINAYGGLAMKLPRSATFFVIAALGMIGLPILGGFVGEFLILLGTFTGVSKGWAIAATLGVILGAAYMLWLVQRLFYGPESKLAASKPPEDLRVGQIAVLAPLAVLMLVMGVAPMIWLPTIITGVHPPSVGTSGFSQINSSGAKAPDHLAALSARLKSCPVTKQDYLTVAKQDFPSGAIQDFPVIAELDFLAIYDASSDFKSGEGQR